MTKRITSLGLIITGLLLIALAAGYTAYDQTISNLDPVTLPEQIAGWHLVQSAAGAQALDEIARLHGKDFPLSSGAVGMYGADHQLKLWVSGSPLKIMATQLVKQMNERIAESSSPFTPTGKHTYENRTVYELDGMGQKHYYFQSNNLVIWLAADPELAMKALQEVLDFYP